MAFASWLIGFALLHGQTTGTTTMATNATSQPVADTGQVPPGAVMRLGGDQKELQPYRVKVNNKEYNFADLLKLKPADTAGAQVEITVPFSFKHPGTLNDLDELNFIKQKIAAGA
ncbi:MAG: hypothetical protein LV481_06350 [Methylacidiphilales bacterium]|nr:hypothetical protein [Candidatus Methylacidiphilales bacterium]